MCVHIPACVWTNGVSLEGERSLLAFLNEKKERKKKNRFFILFMSTETAKYTAIVFGEWHLALHTLNQTIFKHTHILRTRFTHTHTAFKYT